MMPPELDTIGQCAFFGTPMLKNISLPASVSFIGRQAFRTLYGGGLKVLDIYCDHPPYLENAVFNTSDSIIVRVPCGSAALYQSSSEWQNYSNLYYEECVGVREPFLLHVKAYPIPMGNTLHVECSTCPSDSYLEIIDELGHSVLLKPLLSENTLVDISLLNEGMYVLLVLNKNGVLYRGKTIKGSSY